MATKTRTRKPQASREERAAAQRERLDTALQTLHTQVESLQNSDDWMAALAFAARFRRYSFSNAMLIMAQRPDATYVTGYGNKQGTSGWLSMGRQVRKGERGIKILAPRIAKVEDEANPGEYVRRVVGFLTVTVFDVAQTDGDPLPFDAISPTVLDGDDPDGIYAAARTVAEGLGYTVSDGGPDVLGSANGHTTPDRKIVVGEHLPAAQRAKTMVHELAHVLLGHLDAGLAKYVAERDRCEVEAESVAYVVCSVLGLDAGDYSTGYVAGWKGNADLLEATGTAVMKAATAMLDALTGEQADGEVEAA